MPYAKTHPDFVLVLLAALIALGFIVGTSITTGYDGAIVQGDARGYFAYLPSLVLDRDIALENQFEIVQAEGVTAFPYGKGPRGQAADPFPIAPALLWLPGYIAGLAAEALVGRFRSGAHPFGYGAPSVWGAASASILCAAVGAVLTRRLITSTLGRREGIWAVVAVWIGTSALYYTLVTPLYSHAVSWLGVAGTLYLTQKAIRIRSSRWLWLAAGAMAGFMVAIRLADIALLVMPAFMLASALATGPDARPPATGLLSWTCGLPVGYFPQAIASFTLYDRWAPSTPGELGKITTAETFAAVLFSTGHEGWISWTPIAALGLAGLVVLSRRAATEGRHLAHAAILGVLALYLTDVFNPYGPGAAFGGRRYVSATPLLAIGIAGLISTAQRRTLRNAAIVLTCVLVGWNLWLFVSYEVLVNVYRVYPTLAELVRFAVGLGVPR